MEKMKIDCLNFVLLEVDPICSIESPFIRMKLKNHPCDDDGRRPPLLLDIESNTLIMVFHYCKKRAKIKLNENTAEQKKKLKEFDTEFLEYILRYPDSSILLDIFDAALKLRVKSLYDLILDDVARIFNKLSAKELKRTLPNCPVDIASFSWAYSIDATHN